MKSGIVLCLMKGLNVSESRSIKIKIDNFQVSFNFYFKAQTGENSLNFLFLREEFVTVNPLSL